MSEGIHISDEEFSIMLDSVENIEVTIPSSFIHDYLTDPSSSKAILVETILKQAKKLSDYSEALQ